MSASAPSSTYSVHRCRFVDYTPAAVTALAFPPASLPQKKAGSSANAAAPCNVLAVGRANGDIEICAWAGDVHDTQAPQGWVVQQTFYAPLPAKVDSLAFTLRRPSNKAHGLPPSMSDLRLFSAGGGAELLEWDLENGVVLRTISSHGGAIWSIAPNPASTRLALGCEDGSIRLLSLTDDALEHVRRLDRVKTRLLSLAWGPPRARRPPAPASNTSDSDSDDDDDDAWEDTWIVAGCSDSCLRKWDCASGRVLDRMPVDKNRKERTLVWAIGALGDGTVVSGDSLGTVKFWDSITCTELQSYRAHGADVLCLTPGSDGRSVYTSGVDQKVSQFSRIQIRDAGAGPSTAAAMPRWVHTFSRRIHSHDVRALAVWPPPVPLASATLLSVRGMDIAPVLLSGGLDMAVTATPCAIPSITGAGGAPREVQFFNPLMTASLPTFEDTYFSRMPYPVHGLVSIARESRLLLLRRTTSVALWRISAVPTGRDPLAQEGLAPIALPEDRVGDPSGWDKVLEMELKAVTTLCASALSSDGKWLCVAHVYETKLFKLVRGDDDPMALRPVRIKSFSATLLAHLPESADGITTSGASSVAFTPDSRKLIIATTLSGYVLVVDLSGGYEEETRIYVLRRFEQHRMVNVVLGAGAGNGRAVRGLPHAEEADGDIEMADASDGDADAPPAADVTAHETMVSTVTRIAVSPDGQWLATADLRRRVHVFNLDSQQHHCALPSAAGAIASLAFDPARPHLLVAQANNRFQVFDVEARRAPPWGRALCDALPRRLTVNLHEPLVGAVFEPAIDMGDKDAPAAVILWGSTWLCRVTLCAPPVDANPAKRRRSLPKPAAPAAEGESEAAPAPDAAPERGDRNFRIVRKYRPLLCVDFVGPGEMVVVERPVGDVLATLPDAFYKPKYGMT